MEETGGRSGASVVMHRKQGTSGVMDDGKLKAKKQKGVAELA